MENDKGFNNFGLLHLLQFDIFQSERRVQATTLVHGIPTCAHAATVSPLCDSVFFYSPFAGGGLLLTDSAQTYLTGNTRGRMIVVYCILKRKYVQPQKSLAALAINGEYRSVYLDLSLLDPSFLRLSVILASVRSLLHLLGTSPKIRS